MYNEWSHCRNILCVRADNMGDVIMSGPAMRALKQRFHCRITLLTSSMGALIAPYLEEVDDYIVADLPWVKTPAQPPAENTLHLIEQLRARQFDAAVVFTVYSQNPLPAALLLYLAGIPKRLAYCRENPYALLTDWVPEPEPLDLIRHQVQRDLELVKHIGAVASRDSLRVIYPKEASVTMRAKVVAAGIDVNRGFIVVHPGVSEAKREYPVEYWTEIVRLIVQELDVQVVISGSAGDQLLATRIASGTSHGCFVAAGLLNVAEWIALLDKALLTISVNTATIHIAAAVDTPVVVLYALTNPQHTPWKVTSEVLPFSVKEELRSRNGIIAYVNKQLSAKPVLLPEPVTVVDAAKKILSGENTTINTAIVNIEQEQSLSLLQ